MDLLLIMLGLLILLIILNVPISYSIGIVSTIYLVIGGLDLQVLPQRMISTVNSSTLFAIPLFLLAGILMNSAGITERIYNFAQALVGHVRGGLAHVNVMSSMMFASMSGSAVADLVGIGTITTKAMSDKGYKKSFAAALTLSTALISPIIPPSIILIIYGIVAEVSIGRLFIAGILPGLLIGFSLMLMVYILSFKKDFPIAKERESFKNVLVCFKRAILPFLTPIIIVGGIIAGIFTATEAGAIAVLYTLILGTVVYKEINWSKLKRILLKVGVTSSVILFLISTSGILGWAITMERIPTLFSESVLQLTTNPIWIIVLLIILFLVAGLFLDATPIILMMVPVLLPLIIEINYDPIQFGIVVALSTIIGITTPPVGVGLYSLASVLNINVVDIIKEMWPMWLTLFAVLMIVAFWSPLTLFLPKLIFG